MPLSGAQTFSSEPQDLSLQTSMPSMQLSLATNDQQSAPIRTQYAYIHGTSAPSQVSVPTTSDNNLSVPRYVDNNPRPSKSPRHASHQSIHSSSSIANNDGPGEYRYGPPYGGVGSNSTEISPQQSQPPSYGGAASEGNMSNPTSATGPAPPPRDYYPSPNSWTTTAGEANTSTYANGEHRAYAFHDQYKSSSGPKGEHQSPPQPYPAQRGGFDAMNHYSWSTN